MSLANEHLVEVWAFKNEPNSRAKRRQLRRRVLAQVTGIAPAEIDFEKEAGGRPVISGKFRQLPSFNESYSANCYVLAICRTARVGIDIEDGAIPIDAPSTASVACRADELPDNCAPDSAEYGDALLRQWCRKEAILKAWGVGLACNPRRITLASFRNNRFCTNATVDIDGITVVFSDLELSDGVIGSTAIWDSRNNINIAYRTFSAGLE